jgi:hypothetical protein
MLSRTIGDVVASVDSRSKGLVADFLDEVAASPGGALVIAEAASEHTAAALAVGAVEITKVLTGGMPHAQWQLMRRWPVVRPAVQSRTTSLAAIAENTSPALVRMWLIISLYSHRGDSRALRRWLAEAGGIVPTVFSGDRGQSLMASLRYFCWLHAGIGRHRSGPRHGVLHVEPLLEASPTSGETDEFVAEFGSALELDTVERDLSNASGRYLARPGEKYAEGRYGHTRYFVSRGFGVMPLGTSIALARRLRSCADEGIRWAVSACLLQWVFDMPQSHAAELVAECIGDDHPWVVREALTQICESPLLLAEFGGLKVIEQAEDSAERAAQRGWAVTDLRAALARAMAVAVELR